MEEKLKHLDYLQNNVSRMNQCSFQTKGLEIAIIAALLAIYATSISAEKPAGNAIFIFCRGYSLFIVLGSGLILSCKRKRLSETI